MHVQRLRQILESALDQLDNFDEDAEIEVVSNTYFLHNAVNILGTRDGFIDLDNIKEVEQDE